MPFVKKVNPAESTPWGAAVLDSRATVKACQQEYRKARAREEDFEAQLERAQQEMLRGNAESVANDTLDIAAVADAMTAAQHKVDASEKALTVARQRRADAEEALKQAELRAQRGVMRELLVLLDDAARDLDAWLDSGKPVVETYAARRKAVQDLGDLTLNTQLAVADASFKTYLYRTTAPMAGCVTGYEVFQTDERWKAPWSKMNPQPDLADTVKLT